MFCSIVTNGDFEVDVSEQLFTDFLESVKDVRTTIALPGEDGTYFYYSWSCHRDFSYIGCSSELFKDFVDVFL